MAGYRLISTQPQSDEQELLERLKGVPKTKLVTTAREADGLDESSQNGATVKPRYQPREIDCYAITESEMKQLGLSNLLTSAFFGIGSALIAFAIDVDKDLYMAADAAPEVSNLASTISTMCWAFGFAFILLSAGVLWWRRDIVSQIKQEHVKTKA